MSEIVLWIDGHEVTAGEGMTVLAAAQKAGISIPTLCHHEELEPYGACRLCTVEVEVRGRTQLVASCLYPVAADLVVRTRSARVDRIRKVILELLLAHAPGASVLQDLAREYGADSGRFAKQASFCIHCGLCVRYCAEVKKMSAVGFVDRGTRREISFIPQMIAGCESCKECFPLCPTQALQAAFVLTRALTVSPPA